MLTKSNILSLSVNVINISQAVEHIITLAVKKSAAYVCVSNVHMCMEAFDDISFQHIINNADLIVADGRPIYWAQKILGHKQAQQVRGQDLMTELCAYSADKKLNIGLYGGSCDKVLTKVIHELKQQFPNIRITYYFSPPFPELAESNAAKKSGINAELSRDTDQQLNATVIDNINNANVDILFVGIGCPKQERWMAENSVKTSCVMLGVGAAFDFIAREKKHAPKWMQQSGLEWFYRLLAEPKRLAGRYLKQNPRFVYHFLKQLLNKSIQ
ncbi:WecB/TagA/CpsF family glycosyltransferase [Colwellia sp. D2M02]|uniref:WecB/TagA/CpsF family glycosyltransferase n=1 Tax=Colwellia sp. D2M02 TaxID=2841562 RepID=UPI001C097A55|nr:WecB/TagA/CpsF family glycosyltransferase [Colwellia sp. D2M02]